MTSPITLEQVRQVKAASERSLLSKKNVVGVGIGFREKEGQTTDELAIIVSVTKKIPNSQLSPQDLIPQMVDDVPVDVQEVGEIRALS